MIYYATGGLSPDLTIYFDVTPEEGIRRKRAQQVNRLDELDSLFYERVEQEYRKLMRSHIERWVRIDAMRSIEGIHKSVISAVGGRMGYA